MEMFCLLVGLLDTLGCLDNTTSEESAVAEPADDFRFVDTWASFTEPPDLLVLVEAWISVK